jgi:hypothetical protein
LPAIAIIVADNDNISEGPSIVLVATLSQDSGTDSPLLR